MGSNSTTGKGNFIPDTLSRNPSGIKDQDHMVFVSLEEMWEKDLNYMEDKTQNSGEGVKVRLNKEDDNISWKRYLY